MLLILQTVECSCCSQPSNKTPDGFHGSSRFLRFSLFAAAAARLQPFLAIPPDTARTARLHLTWCNEEQQVVHLADKAYAPLVARYVLLLSAVPAIAHKYRVSQILRYHSHHAAKVVRRIGVDGYRQWRPACRIRQLRNPLAPRQADNNRGLGVNRPTVARLPLLLQPLAL